MVKVNIVRMIFSDRMLSHVKQMMEVRPFASMEAVARIHLSANFYGALQVKHLINAIAKMSMEAVTEIAAMINIKQIILHVHQRMISVECCNVVISTSD